MDWSIIEFIKKTTSMKIVLKGIHRGDDAVKAVKYGCDGIIVSNHGGRQLDGTPGTIDMLAMISLALKKEGLIDKIEIIFDGGIRRGTDIFKAFALGANAVMCGRASLWGLGAGGKDGIIKAFDLLKRELINVMQLAGCKTLKDITSDFLITPDSYPKF